MSENHQRLMINMTDASPVITARNECKVEISQEEYDSLIYWAQIAQTQTRQLQNSFWTETLKHPEGTQALKEAVTEVINSTLKSWAEIQKGELKYSAVRIGAVIILLAGIIGTATWLTSIGKLDSSGLIFLLGTVTGYLLTFLTKIETGSGVA